MFIFRLEKVLHRPVLRQLGTCSLPSWTRIKYCTSFIGMDYPRNTRWRKMADTSSATLSQERERERKKHASFNAFGFFVWLFWKPPMWQLYLYLPRANVADHGREVKPSFHLTTSTRECVKVRSIGRRAVMAVADLPHAFFRTRLTV